MAGRSAADYLPERESLSALREAASHCQGCDLYQRAIQTVFGEGLVRSELMLVGEQPGDVEDRAGRPFVGPAGRLLDHLLQEAGIDRTTVYVTNAVKHFKWKRPSTKKKSVEEELGPIPKRRLHDKPNLTEVRACKPWLEAEIRIVAPRLIVCLGATAALALAGRSVKLTRDRGRIIESAGEAPLMVTQHPSAILRIPDRDDRHAARCALIEDLEQARRFIEGR